MKLTKKVLSIALAVLMLCSCLAVSVSADTSSFKSDKYDDNILFSYDQYIRDYSYGTGISSHCPQQVTFNKDGWVRLQSQTEEEEQAYLQAKASGDAAAMEANEGQYEHQWQYFLFPTPEYQVQFKNAVANCYENYNSVFSCYGYVASAKLANPNGQYDESAQLDLSISIKVVADIDGDGEYETEIELGQERIDTVKHSQFGYRYQNVSFSLGALNEIIEMGCDFKLKTVLIQPRSYAFEKGDKNEKGQEGIALVDVYYSPFYVENIPGFESYDRFSYQGFDASTMLDPSSFTLGTLNTEDFQWEELVQTENDDNLPVYGELGYGDLKRDENHCPIKKDGTSYNPIPIVKKSDEQPVYCSNLKASVSGSNVTLTWTATGGKAKSFFVHESTGKHSVTVATNSATIKNLPAGTYKFRVKGTNTENKAGDYTDYISVTVNGACVHSATTVKTTPATYFAAGKKETVCTSCKKVIKTETIAQLKLKAPKVKYVGGKKKITVKYTAVAGATGFQVKYKVGKKWKTKTYNTAKSANKVIKKLKKGKTQVQVRAMVKSGSLKAYSAWTKLKKVKVK